jgi:hypothetical protein
VSRNLILVEVEERRNSLIYYNWCFLQSGFYRPLHQDEDKTIRLVFIRSLMFMRVLPGALPPTAATITPRRTLVQLVAAVKHHPIAVTHSVLSSNFRKPNCPSSTSTTIPPDRVNHQV